MVETEDGGAYWRVLLYVLLYFMGLMVLSVGLVFVLVAGIAYLALKIFGMV